MRRLSRPTISFILGGVLWGLMAGFLPYPTFVVVASQGNLGAISHGLQQIWPLVVVWATVAGLVAAVLSRPFKYLRRLHLLVGLAWWVLTGLLAFGVGLFATFLLSGLYLTIRYGQPLGFDLFSTGAFFGLALALGLLPMTGLGLISYPAFLLLRRRFGEVPIEEPAQTPGADREDLVHVDETEKRWVT